MVAPVSARAAETRASISSALKALGRNLSSTAISAFSLSASSVRPACSNWTIESSRCLICLRTTATASVSAIPPAAPGAVSITKKADFKARNAVNATVSFARMASLIASVSPAWIEFIPFHKPETTPEQARQKGVRRRLLTLSSVETIDGSNPKFGMACPGGAYHLMSSRGRGAAGPRGRGDSAGGVTPDQPGGFKTGLRALQHRSLNNFWQKRRDGGWAVR